MSRDLEGQGYLFDNSQESDRPLPHPNGIRRPFVVVFVDQVKRRKRTTRARPILSFLESRDRPVKDRVVRRMEAVVAAVLGEDPALIDWDSIEWDKWINVIITILLAILPLLI